MSGEWRKECQRFLNIINILALILTFRKVADMLSCNLSEPCYNDVVVPILRKLVTEVNGIMKNLFLTGSVGCGKSTSIAAAMGDNLGKAGGFLTVRQKDETGRAVAYWLQKPDGTEKQCIIDYSARPYTMYQEVFEEQGVRLLEEALQYDYVILDEIGGFEVLSEKFMAALMTLLQSDIPCIGVMKGEGPANKMIQKLGLGEAYVSKADQLRRWMRHDEDTVLYECGQFDPEGLHLAHEWVRTHCK